MVSVPTYCRTQILKFCGFKSDQQTSDAGVGESPLRSSLVAEKSIIIKQFMVHDGPLFNYLAQAVTQEDFSNRKAALLFYSKLIQESLNHSGSSGAIRISYLQNYNPADYEAAVELLNDLIKNAPHALKEDLEILATHRYVLGPRQDVKWSLTGGTNYTNSLCALRLLISQLPFKLTNTMGSLLPLDHEFSATKQQDISHHYLPAQSNFAIIRELGQVFVYNKQNQQKLLMWNKGSALQKAEEVLGKGKFGVVMSQGDKAVKTLKYGSDDDLDEEINIRLAINEGILEAKFAMAAAGVAEHFAFGLWNIKNKEQLRFIMPKIEVASPLCTSIDYELETDRLAVALFLFNIHGFYHGDLCSSINHASYQNVITALSGLQVLIDMDSSDLKRTHPLQIDQWLWFLNWKNPTLRAYYNSSDNPQPLTINREKLIALCYESLKTSHPIRIPAVIQKILQFPSDYQDKKKA